MSPSPTRSPVITWTDKKGQPQQLKCTLAPDALELILKLMKMKMSFSVTYINWDEIQMQNMIESQPNKEQS